MSPKSWYCGSHETMAMREPGGGKLFVVVEE